LANYKLDVARLNSIVKKTIDAVNKSKNEIYDIAENARRECKRLEEELWELKQKVKSLIDSVEMLEEELKESKRKLLLVNKNFEKYSQEELKSAYEKADSLRVELAVKREQEQYLIRRRNELEARIKDAYKTVQKADNLICHVGVALGFLTGDLREISSQLEDIQQKQLIGLRIIRAQEEERQRVAREIHDGPAQSMSNVVLKAEICERLIDVDVEKSRTELQNLKKIVRESLQDVRKIIYDLRPMSLDDLGLVPTLQRYVMTFQDDTGLFVLFKTKGTYDDLRPEISLTVFRIVQEAFNNIKKHACAQNVVLNLEFRGNDLKMYIYDDGKGFDEKKIKVDSEEINSGFGLLSMRERIELLGGDFKINSKAGMGTRLIITVPLVQKEDGENDNYTNFNSR
jgi:two-component system sensor histidine kinase DegS